MQFSIGGSQSFASEAKACHLACADCVNPYDSSYSLSSLTSSTLAADTEPSLIILHSDTMSEPLCCFYIFNTRCGIYDVSNITVYYSITSKFSVVKSYEVEIDDCD